MKKAFLIASLALAVPGYASFVEEAQELNGHYRTVLTKKEYMEYDLDLFKEECRFVFKFIECVKNSDRDNIIYLSVQHPLPRDINKRIYAHNFFEKPTGSGVEGVTSLVEKVMNRRFPGSNPGDIKDIDEFEKVATKLFNEKGAAMKKQLSEFKE